MFLMPPDFLHKLQIICSRGIPIMQSMSIRYGNYKQTDVMSFPAGDEICVFSDSKTRMRAPYVYGFATNLE